MDGDELREQRQLRTGVQQLCSESLWQGDPTASLWQQSHAQRLTQPASEGCVRITLLRTKRMAMGD